MGGPVVSLGKANSFFASPAETEMWTKWWAPRRKGQVDVAPDTKASTLSKARKKLKKPLADKTPPATTAGQAATSDSGKASSLKGGTGSATESADRKKDPRARASAARRREATPKPPGVNVPAGDAPEEARSNHTTQASTAAHSVGRRTSQAGAGNANPPPVSGPQATRRDSSGAEVPPAPSAGDVSDANSASGKARRNSRRRSSVVSPRKSTKVRMKKHHRNVSEKKHQEMEDQDAELREIMWEKQAALRNIKPVHKMKAIIPVLQLMKQNAEKAMMEKMIPVSRSIPFLLHSAA